MEAGGVADKVGGRYEDLWGVRLLLRIVEEDLRSVVHEPVGSGADGGDYRLDFVGHRELHQCKEGNGFSGKWTLKNLYTRGVLLDIRTWLSDSPENRYCFVSGDPAPELNELIGSAKNSEDAVSFYKYQIGPVKERRVAFGRFCEALGLVQEDPSDQATARDLLRRCDVHLFPDSDEQKRELKTRIRLLIHGEPDKILRVLRDWINERLRDVISFGEIQEILGEQFPLRRLAMDPRVWPAFGTLNERFRKSLVPFLISGRLLPRSETQKVLEALARPEVRVVVLHGIAGSGKSGVSYELTEIFAEQKRPYLALRLDQDQTRLRGSTILYGQSMGLPESPVLCLQGVAGERSAVLVLDQLDALRWSSGHSSEAWQVCRELIVEALSSPYVQVIVCCRTYDLQNDPQFKAWTSGVVGLVPIEVGNLNVDTVRDVVERSGRRYEGLGTVKRRLLRQVQNLRAWSEVVSRGNTSFTFDNDRSLLRELWRSRYDALEGGGIPRARAEAILDGLVGFMNREGVLSAPRSLMETSGHEEATLQSLHVVVMDGDRVSFGHQSYLDFLVARRLMKDMDQSGATVLGWLGGRERQSLFMREQLRLVLGFLRDERPTPYVETLRELLKADGVRFHLKQLVLSQVSQIGDPRPEEVSLVGELAADDAWRPHVLREVVAASAAWFRVLQNGGLFAGWLASGDLQARDDVLFVLDRQAKKFGDEVVALLAPQEAAGAEWDERLFRVLPTDASEDSDALFALRLRLARRGYAGMWYYDWDGMRKRSLQRFSDLVLALLAGHCAEATTKSVGFASGSRHNIWPAVTSHDLAGVETESLVETFLAVAQGVEDLRLTLSEPNSPGLLREMQSLSLAGPQSLLVLLRALAEEVLTRSEAQFFGLLERGGAQALPSQVAILEVLGGSATITSDLADTVLAWLMDRPDRLHLESRDDSAWDTLVGMALKKLTDASSDQAFRRFEDFLLAFRDPGLQADYSYRYGARKQSEPKRRSLTWPTFAGMIQYRLLPRLSIERRSRKTVVAIQAVRRKFADWEPELKTNDSVDGWGRSPIAIANRLELVSDRAWLKIVVNPKLRSADELSYYDKLRRQGLSSIASYAADFRTLAGRQPERFARLALRLPEGADPSFLAAIMSGLGSSERHVPGATELRGEDASQEALEALLLSPQVRGRHDLAKEYCAVVDTRHELPWSDDVLLHVAEIARTHPDPAPGYFPVITDPDEDDRLSLNALNTCRGRAAFAIRRLLFGSPERLELFRPAIEALIADPHPAVRAGSIRVCLPVLQSDRDQAVSWFVTACCGDERILGADEAFEFLRYTVLGNLEKLEALLRAMMRSRRAVLAERGANLIAACFIQSNLLEGLFTECIHGDIAQRKGVAQRAGLLLASRDHHAQAKRWVLQLANDDVEEVHEVLERAVTAKVLELLDVDGDFARDFAVSNAVASDPVPLLTALEVYPGEILKFADCILEAARSVMNEPRRQFRRVPAVHVLVPLLLRLYEQAQGADDSSISRECLDVWDSLLNQRLAEAVDLAKALDSP